MTQTQQIASAAETEQQTMMAAISKSHPEEVSAVASVYAEYESEFFGLVSAELNYAAAQINVSRSHYPEAWTRIESALAAATNEANGGML